MLLSHTMPDRLSPTTSVLSVRVNPDERAILEAAAEQSRTSISDFVRRKAVESAEIEVLGRVVVTIPAKDWDAFEVWVTRLAEAIPALAELARRVTWSPAHAHAFDRFDDVGKAQHGRALGHQNTGTALASTFSRSSL